MSLSLALATPLFAFALAAVIAAIVVAVTYIARRRRSTHHPRPGRRRTTDADGNPRPVGLVGSAPLRRKDIPLPRLRHYHAGMAAAAPWLRFAVLAALLVSVVEWTDPAGCASQLQQPPAQVQTSQRHAFTTGTADGRATIRGYNHAFSGTDRRP
ncbi:MAG: hypothetical protein ACRDMV_20990 [Streptosporangiales bacterium]